MHESTENRERFSVSFYVSGRQAEQIFVKEYHITGPHTSITEKRATHHKLFLA
jgi:hypothetical protein